MLGWGFCNLGTTLVSIRIYLLTRDTEDVFIFVLETQQEYHRLHHLVLQLNLCRARHSQDTFFFFFEHVIRGWIKPSPWLRGTDSQARKTDKQINSFHSKWQVLCRNWAHDARGTQARANKSDRVAGNGFSEELISKLSVSVCNHLWLWLQFPELRWESTSWSCFSEFLTLSQLDLVPVFYEGGKEGREEEREGRRKSRRKRAGVKSSDTDRFQKSPGVTGDHLCPVCILNKGVVSSPWRPFSLQSNSTWEQNMVFSNLRNPGELSQWGAASYHTRGQRNACPIPVCTGNWGQTHSLTLQGDFSTQNVPSLPPSQRWNTFVILSCLLKPKPALTSFGIPSPTLGLHQRSEKQAKLLP